MGVIGKPAVGGDEVATGRIEGSFLHDTGRGQGTENRAAVRVHHDEIVPGQVGGYHQSVPRTVHHQRLYDAWDRRDAQQGAGQGIKGEQTAL
jgi:hypothetical protein